MVALTPLLAGQRAAAPFSYRGFTPGMAYRAFSEQARALSGSEVLRCNTPATTAQLMECGVAIRDPSDGARFYLSAYVIEGKIAMLSFGDSGDSRLVARTQQDLRRRFGSTRTVRQSNWEWKSGHRAARLTWRGRGSARWIYVNLTDYDLLNGISRYVRASKPKPS